MTIKFTCPESEVKSIYPDKYAGKVFVCKHCGEKHKLPLEPSEPDPKDRFIFECENTGERMRLKAEVEGKKIKCPKCDEFHHAVRHEGAVTVRKSASSPENRLKTIRKVKVEDEDDSIANDDSEDTGVKKKPRRESRANRSVESRKIKEKSGSFKFVLLAALLVLVLLSVCGAYFYQKEQDKAYVINVLAILKKAGASYVESDFEKSHKTALLAMNQMKLKESLFDPLQKKQIVENQKFFEHQNEVSLEYHDLQKEVMKKPNKDNVRKAHLKMNSAIEVLKAMKRDTSPLQDLISKQISILVVKEEALLKEYFETKISSVGSLYLVGQVQRSYSEMLEILKEWDQIKRPEFNKLNARIAEQVKYYQGKVDKIRKAKEIYSAAEKTSEFLVGENKLQKMVEALEGDDLSLKEPIQKLFIKIRVSRLLQDVKDIINDKTSTLVQKRQALEALQKTLTKDDELVRESIQGQLEILSQKKENSATKPAAQSKSEAKSKTKSEIKSGPKKKFLDLYTKSIHSYLRKEGSVEKSYDAEKQEVLLKTPKSSNRIGMKLMKGKPRFIYIEKDSFGAWYPAQFRIDPAYFAKHLEAFHDRLSENEGLDAHSKDAWSVNGFLLLNGPTQMIESKGAKGSKMSIDGKIYSSKNIVFNAKQAEVYSKELATKGEVLKNAILNHKDIDKVVGKSAALLVESTYKKINRLHYLQQPFARMAIFSGYLKKNIPDCPNDILALADSYKKYFQENISTQKKYYFGEAKDGSSFEFRYSVDSRALLIEYDASKDQTRFMSRPNFVELDYYLQVGVRLGFAAVFKGRHTDWPDKASVIGYETHHPAYGLIAKYDMATKSYDFDQNKWNQAVNSGARSNAKQMPDFYLAPHSLILDGAGQVQAIITPNGTIEAPSFGFGLEGDALFAKKEDWLDRCAKVLTKSGELNLIFKYFVKYTFDSPLPQYTNLIGNNNERGDFHQTAYQTLDRKLGDKLLCDCDDLAEVYANLVRRQGKNSFVMGVPSHATCSWVEKTDKGFELFFLDTGTPRRFTGATLDKVMEQGFKSYDPENRVQFSPRQITVLLRFAGEQVRQRYLLDSKIFVDEEYGKKMVDVQGGWHHFYYLQSLETMLDVVKKDSSPANLFEVSSLYQHSGLNEKGIEYREKSIAKIKKGDFLGKIKAESVLIGLYIKGEYEDKALALTRKLAKEVSSLKGGLVRSTRPMRFSICNYLVYFDEPFEAYRLIKKDIGALKNKFNSVEASSVIKVWSKMMELQREGREFVGDEKEVMGALQKSLEIYNKKYLFQKKHAHNENMRNYISLYRYYSGLLGPKVAAQKLKVGTYPENKKREHFKRFKANEDLDWQWMRLNVYNYASARAAMLKTDDPKVLPSKKQWSEAGAYVEAMVDAYEKAETFGHDSRAEYSILNSKLSNAAYHKNWEEVDFVLDRMKKDNWTAFYRMLVRTIGGASKYSDLAGFKILIEKFIKRSPPKQHYFAIVYYAMANKKYEHAKAMAELARKKFPNDLGIQKEYKLLIELLRTLPAQKSL